jgi:hypothetical protein
MIWQVVGFLTGLFVVSMVASALIRHFSDKGLRK